MKKVLMIAGDFTEDYEVMVPYQALLMAGVAVDVVCPEKEKGDNIKRRSTILKEIRLIQKSQDISLH